MGSGNYSSSDIGAFSIPCYFTGLLPLNVGSSNNICQNGLEARKSALPSDFSKIN